MRADGRIRAVELIDPQADLAVADPHQVARAVAGHIGDFPAVGLRHFRDAGHFDRVVEKAEAGARGHENAGVGRHDANEIGEAVAVHVRELHAGVAQAQAGGRRGDELGGVKSRAVPALQPDPAVAVVVAQDVDPAVEVEIDECDAWIAEIEADVERQGGGFIKRGRAAADKCVGVALPRPVEEVLHAVAGHVGEARGGSDRGGGRIFQVDPGGEPEAADVFAVAPGAGLAFEEVR